MCMCGRSRAERARGGRQGGGGTGSLLESAVLRLTAGKKPLKGTILHFLTQPGFCQWEFCLRKDSRIKLSSSFSSRIWFLFLLAVPFYKAWERQWVLLCTREKHLFPVSVYGIILVQRKICARAPRCALRYLFTGRCFLFLLGFAPPPKCWCEAASLGSCHETD